MNRNAVAAIYVGVVGAILIIVMMLIGSAVVAQQQRAYLETVQAGMSEEGFDEYMLNKQMQAGR